MKKISLAGSMVIALMMPGAALANYEPTIVDACLRTLETYLDASGVELNAGDIEPINVRSFPEKNPPVVTFEAYSANAALRPAEWDYFDEIFFGQVDELVEEKDIIDEVLSEIDGEQPSMKGIGYARCFFKNNTAPFDLMIFECGTIACTEPTPDAPSLEGLKELLAREGL